MAVYDDNLRIMIEAIYFLKKYRCGFEECRAKVEYLPITDEWGVGSYS